MNASQEMRRLTRDPERGIVAGVCVGLGEYFGTDAVLVRLGFVLALLLNGLGVIAYIVCWIVIPRRDVPGAAAGRGEAEAVSGAAGTPASAAPADRIVEEVREAGQRAREAGERVVEGLGRTAPRLGGGRAVAGVVMILVGLAFLLRRYDFFDWWDWNVVGRLWPVLLILIGIAIVLDALRGGTR